jgi:hypothetical protein
MDEGLGEELHNPVPEGRLSGSDRLRVENHIRHVSEIGSSLLDMLAVSARNINLSDFRVRTSSDHITINSEDSHRTAVFTGVGLNGFSNNELFRCNMLAHDFLFQDDYCFSVSLTFIRVT